MQSIADELARHADSVVTANVGDVGIRWHVQGARSTCCSGDAALALGLMPGMRGGVPLTLEAPVSPALLASSARIQALLHSWDPHMRPIPVKAPCRDNRGPLAHGVGLFFSGGVDSFYSLVTHVEELTHLVTINGLDGIHDRRLIAMAQEVAKDQGLTLVIVTTDARNAVRGLAWQEFGHGAVLASCGLLLQNEMRKIYIASSKDPAHLEPAGTHPDLDPLWGTERLEFSHDTLVSRLEKISHIAHSPTAMKHLRVCWKRPDLYNCGECEKCIRTMIGLELASALQRSDTLPNELDMTKVARLRLRGRGLRRASSLREAAQEAGKAELAAALGRSIRSSKLRMTAKTSLGPLRPLIQTTRATASVLRARLVGHGA